MPKVDLKIKDYEKGNADAEQMAFITKVIYEMSKPEIDKLLAFFQFHKVKVIEKDNEQLKEDHRNRKSGRSSLRHSQSIASEDPNAPNSQDN